MYDPVETPLIVEFADGGEEEVATLIRERGGYNASVRWICEENDRALAVVLFNSWCANRVLNSELSEFQLEIRNGRLYAI